MKYKGINLNIVIIVIILVISIFFVGKYLLKLYNVEQPLFEKINAIEEVKEVKIVNGKEKIDIYLNLMSGVELYSLYQKVENVIKEEIEIDKSNILINNSSELEDIYYKIHFAIYEG